MKKTNALYILSNGRVAAINKKDGQIMWEVKLKDYLKNSSISYAVGQISVEDDKLFIGVAGILLCLRSKDGSLVWVNELKGWGYSFVSLANVGSEGGAAEAAQAAAGSVASTAAIAAT